MNKEVDELVKELYTLISDMRPVLFRLRELTELKVKFHKNQVKYYNNSNIHLHKSFIKIFDEISQLNEDLYDMKEVQECLCDI